MGRKKQAPTKVISVRVPKKHSDRIEDEFKIIVDKFKIQGDVIHNHKIIIKRKGKIIATETKEDMPGNYTVTGSFKIGKKYKAKLK